MAKVVQLFPPAPAPLPAPAAPPEPEAWVCRCPVCVRLEAEAEAMLRDRRIDRAYGPLRGAATFGVFMVLAAGALAWPVAFLVLVPAALVTLVRRVRA